MESCGLQKDDIFDIATKNINNQISNILDLSSKENLTNRLLEILKISVDNKFSDFLNITPINGNKFRLDHGIIFWIVNECSMIMKNYYNQQLKKQENFDSFRSKKIESVIAESIIITIIIPVFEAIMNKLPISKIYVTVEDFQKFYSFPKVLKILESGFENNHESKDNHEKQDNKNEDKFEIYLQKSKDVANEILAEFLNFI